MDFIAWVSFQQAHTIGVARDVFPSVLGPIFFSMHFLVLLLSSSRQAIDGCHVATTSLLL